MVYIDENEYPKTLEGIIDAESASVIVDKLNEAWEELKNIDVNSDEHQRKINAINHYIESQENCWGIKITHNWPGHRGKFFLPTQEDAFWYNEYLSELEMDAYDYYESYGDDDYEDEYDDEPEYDEDNY